MPEHVKTVEVIEAYNLAAKTASGVPAFEKLQVAYSLFENALSLEAKLADKDLVLAAKNAKEAAFLITKEQAYKFALASETAKAIGLSSVKLEAIFAAKLAVIFMAAEAPLDQALVQMPLAMVPISTLVNAFAIANTALQAAVLTTACNAANVLYIKAAEQEASILGLLHKP